MRFCFIVAERYIQETSLVQQVIEQLRQWDHTVDVVLPRCATFECSVRSCLKSYDALVLKVTQEELGLAVLEVADALGIPTLNTPRAIRLVSNKAAATAYGTQRGIAFPRTYYLGSPHAFSQVPQDAYPLVLKPNTGSFKYTHTPTVCLVPTAKEAAQLQLSDDQDYLAVSYVENLGFDMKVYVSGQKIFATTRTSPLHAPVTHHAIPVTQEMSELALRIGSVFGLDLYGVDVLQTPQGLVPIDVNPFPGYHDISDAEVSIAEHILSVAKQQRIQRAGVDHRRTLARLRL